MSNKEVEVTYRNGKGKVVTRTITNIELDYGKHNDKEQWIVKALCCNTNKSIIIGLVGTKFG